MRFNQSLCLLALGCASFSLCAQSANVPLTVVPVPYTGIAPIDGSETLIYEVLERTPASLGLGISSPVLQETRMERKPNGHQIYTTASSKHVFDPVTMASTLKAKLDASVDLQVTSKKIGASWSVGQVWRAAFVSPPQVKSLCPRPFYFQYTAKAVSEGTHSFMLRGKPYAASTVTVQMDGTWSTKGCGSGVAKGLVTYAPALQVITAYTGEIVAGRAKFSSSATLKEVNASISQK